MPFKVKFIHSEKVTNFCQISTIDLSYVVTVKSTEILQWRFRKILWPSQNVWTLRMLIGILFKITKPLPFEIFLKIYVYNLYLRKYVSSWKCNLSQTYLISRKTHELTTTITFYCIHLTEKLSCQKIALCGIYKNALRCTWKLWICIIALKVDKNVKNSMHVTEV